MSSCLEFSVRSRWRQYLRLVPAAASLALGLSRPDAHGQVLEYAYRQTNADASALESIMFRVPADGNPSWNRNFITNLQPPSVPATATAVLAGDSGRIPLERIMINTHTNGQSITTVVFAKRFATTAELTAAMPDGEYTVMYSGFGSSPTPTSYSFRFTYAAPTMPRVTNYSTLQDWSGENLTIAWAPPGSFADQSEIRLIDSTGRPMMYVPITTATPGSMTVAGVRADPGAVFSGEIGAATTLIGWASPQAGVAATQQILRFSIRRAVTTTPVTPPPATSAVPTISTHPVGTTILNGAAATLSATASGEGLTYQWRRDGVVIGGATGSTLHLPAAGFADAGAYTVTVTNGAGSVTSEVARLTVNPVSRIGNVSLLTALDGGDDAFTLGYVVGNASAATPKPLVIRAAGPSLGVLGVPGTLAQPSLELFAGSNKTAENSRWGGAVALRDAMASVGAFPFADPDSRDAAALADIKGRDNSVKISSADGGSGIVIAEIYDATPPSQFTVASPRLLNVSVLKPLGSGVTLGFVIAGAAPKAVLVRAIGPTLGAAPFELPGVVADPQLTLFNSSQQRIGDNNNWGGTAALRSTFGAVGAFGLAADSLDAALTTTLPPGNYTVEVKGAGSGTGIALIEVYEVP